MKAAAALAVLLGLAVLDCGARARADFISASAGLSSLSGAGEGDFILGKSQSAAAAEEPSAPCPGERWPEQKFLPNSPGSGAGSPSSGVTGGSPTAPHALAGPIHQGRREPPLPAGFLRAPQVRHFPDPCLSSIFHPPR
jgi:hypothetical protein